MGAELDLMHGAGEQVRHARPVRDAQPPGGHGYGPRLARIVEDDRDPMPGVEPAKGMDVMNVVREPSSAPQDNWAGTRAYFEMTATSDSLPG